MKSSISNYESRISSHTKNTFIIKNLRLQAGVARSTPSTGNLGKPPQLVSMQQSLGQLLQDQLVSKQYASLFSREKQKPTNDGYSSEQRGARSGFRGSIFKLGTTTPPACLDSGTSRCEGQTS